MRAWSVLLVTAAVWAGWTRLAAWPALGLLLATLPLTAVANGLRLVGMGLVAEHWGPGALHARLGHARPAW